MQSMSPAEVVEAFGQCARALDEDGARALSIGWNEPGDAPRRLYKQASATSAARRISTYSASRRP